MKKRVIALLLLMTMLFSVGCGTKQEQAEETQNTPVQTEETAKKTEKKTDKKNEKKEEKKDDKKDDKKAEEEKEEESTQAEKTSAKSSSGSSGTTKKPAGFTSSKAYYVKVNRQMNTVTVYTKDSDGLFTVPYKAMVCSTGYETPVGTYDISYQGQWNWLALVGGVYGQYCTQITGDYLFHSVPYTQRYNKGSLQKGEYDKLGTTCSHGCIRLTVADAKWIYDNKYNIARVELYNSSDAGPLGKPYAQKIGGTANQGWDPTDPDSSNPWRNAKVTVGNYVGKTEAAAKQAAQTLGLTVGSSSYQFSDNAKGTVIAQSLSSGASVLQGSTITFTISKGPEMISVGSYVGMSEAEAVSAAKSAGLSVGRDYQYSDSAEGVVIAQSLSSGASVKKGSTITLTVSLGAEPVTVGYYVGMTEAEAAAQIEVLGLNVAVVYQESDTDGIVLDQSVAADTSVAVGTTITLTVSQMAAAVEE